MTTSPEGYNPQETQAQDAMPHERLRAIDKRRIAFEWLVAAVMVLAVNGVALMALDHYDPNRFRVQVKVKYELLRERGGEYDSLILGDSTPNQGVMPVILDEELGGKWLNLSTAANMLAMSSAWFLEEYIETYGPPKEVVICQVPDMWPREVDPLVLSQAEESVFKFDTLDPSIQMSLGEKLLMCRTRWLPLYSKNDSLSRIAIKPWKATDLRDAFGQDGFMVLHGQEDGWREDLEEAKLEHLQKPFRVSQINELAILRVIELAQEHGFMVYLTTGTASEGLAASAGYQRNFTDMMKQYEKWDALSDHLTVILPEPQVFKDELMYDEDHVNVDGAALWSQRIADAIKQARSGVEASTQDPRPTSTGDDLP